MRKPILWTGVVTGAVVGACSRLTGLAFGKAIAFTYAVIVSLVANVMFDFVREPPRATLPEVAAVSATDGPTARARLSASGPASAAAAAPTKPPVSTAMVALPQLPPISSVTIPPAGTPPMPAVAIDPAQPPRAPVAPSVAPPPVDNPRPGPGSGGLY
jgi:hypothetical protein